MVLAASEIDNVLPAAVLEAPRLTVAAESVSVTLLADVEVTLEAVVLAVTLPVAAPMFRFVVFKLAVVVEMEPVIPIVVAVSVSVPAPV